MGRKPKTTQNELEELQEELEELQEENKQLRKTVADLSELVLTEIVE